MPPARLPCPHCGTDEDATATSCRFCGIDLVHGQCAACLQPLFVGSRKCPSCGAPAADAVEESARGRRCPRCAVELAAAETGGVRLDRCATCLGTWLDRPVLERLRAERSQQSELLWSLDPSGQAPVVDGGELIACALCGNAMERLRYADPCPVVIDRCLDHGVWFDRDELRRVAEYLVTGSDPQAGPRPPAPPPVRPVWGGEPLQPEPRPQPLTPEEIANAGIDPSWLEPGALLGDPKVRRRRTRTGDVLLDALVAIGKELLK